MTESGSLDILRKAVAGQSLTRVINFGQRKGDGFGAAYLFLLNFLMESLGKGLGFALLETTHPCGFATKRGYTDYFIPFCDEIRVELPGLIHNDIFHKLTFKKPLGPWVAGHLLDLLSVQYRNRRYLWWFKHPETSGGDSRKPYFPESNDWHTNRSNLMKTLWSYNDQTRDEVKRHRSLLNLPEKYIGVHLRGGDKHAASVYAPLGRIQRMVSSQALSCLPIYVATDDFSCFRKLQELLPSRQVVTLARPKRQGYHNSEFQQKARQERRDATTLLFAELEALWNSYHFIGSQTTNISHLVGIYRNHSMMNWAD